MDTLIGKTLDQTYRIDELIGRGGMGAVYRGHDLSLARDVAIKVMNPHYTSDQGFQDRFRQEARAIASLNHQGIVQVFACGQDLDVLYIVMDHVAGQTLDAWLRHLAQESKIVDLRDSLRLVRQVALALHYAHERGILHRDVKPANILLRPVDPALREADELPFQPILTDFGLAKLAEGSVHTQTGVTMGTPAYMSPEQCLGRTPDRRSDVYSLGIVLYELTTGVPPFEIKSLTEAIRCHTQQPPPPPRTRNPDLPVEVENTVLRALGKRPADRYTTAREMADALRMTIANLPDGVIVAPVHAPAYAPVPATGDEDTAVSDLSFDGELVVMQNGEQAQRLSLRGKTMLTIGRTDDNDLCLPGAKVSRKHARLEFDGRGIAVVDLQSTNGTFLGDTRLLPGVPQPWTPGVLLLIGDSELSLQGGAVHATGESSPGQTVLSEPEPTDGGRISVSTVQFTLKVAPGAQVSATFTATNAGAQVDHFETSVHGIPSEWVIETPPVVRLLPNDRQELSVTFCPPRTPQSRAGNYPFTIDITSQANARQSVQIRGSLRITAYHEFTVDLQPQKQTGVSEGTFDLQLENGGNIDLDVHLQASDLEQGCVYAFSPAHATVPAGGQSAVKLNVHPRIPLPGEMARTYFFTVVARPAQVPELARQVQGQWVQAAPSLEARLDPTRQQSAGRATFQLQVSNQSLADMTVVCEASRLPAGLEGTFDPPQVAVPAAGEGSTRLQIKSRDARYGQDPVEHAFTVTVTPVDAPRFAQQVSGTWIQLPGRRSLWPPALLTVAGWCLAWFVYWLILASQVIGPLIELLGSAGVPWEIVEFIAWPVAGLVCCLLGGIVTGLALRWAEPKLRGGQVFWIGLLWGMVWSTSFVVAAVTQVPFEGGITAVVFWTAAGGAMGAVGGLFTGIAVRRAGGERYKGLPIVSALGWALGWALGEWGGESLVQSGLYEHLSEPLGLLPILTLAVAGSAVGSAIIFGRIGRSQKR